MDNIITALITDHTAADVARAKYLNSLWNPIAEEWSSTAAEYAEWKAGVKGAYNAKDLNRVGAAVEYLYEVLAGLPAEIKAYAAERGVAWDVFFDVPAPPEGGVTAKTDWTKSDLPDPESMAVYLDNVTKLRNALDYETDALPTTMENLTISGANAIEKALSRLDEEIKLLRAKDKKLLENTAASWYYAGDLFSGEI